MGLKHSHCKQAGTRWFVLFFLRPGSLALPPSFLSSWLTPCRPSCYSLLVFFLAMDVMIPVTTAWNLHVLLSHYCKFGGLISSPPRIARMQSELIIDTFSATLLFSCKAMTISTFCRCSTFTNVKGKQILFCLFSSPIHPCQSAS